MAVAAPTPRIRKPTIVLTVPISTSLNDLCSTTRPTSATILTSTAGVPKKSLMNVNTDCIPVSSTCQRLQIVTNEPSGHRFLLYRPCRPRQPQPFHERNNYGASSPPFLDKSTRLLTFVVLLLTLCV